MPMTFSEHLLQLRTARDLSQKALAAEIGISWRTYQNYELGLRSPPSSITVARQYCLIFAEVLSEMV